MMEFIVANIEKILGVVGAILGCGFAFHVKFKLDKYNKINVPGDGNFTAVDSKIINSRVVIDNKKYNIIVNNGNQPKDNGGLYVVIGSICLIFSSYFYMAHGQLVLSILKGFTYLIGAYSAIFLVFSSWLFGLPKERLFSIFLSIVLVVVSVVLVLSEIERGYYPSYADFVETRAVIRAFLDLTEAHKSWVFSQVVSIWLFIISLILNSRIAILEFTKHRFFDFIGSILFLASSYFISKGYAMSYFKFPL